MSLAEKLIEQGRQEGHHKGLEEGRQEGLQKGARGARRETMVKQRRLVLGKLPAGAVLPVQAAAEMDRTGADGGFARVRARRLKHAVHAADDMVPAEVRALVDGVLEREVAEVFLSFARKLFRKGFQEGFQEGFQKGFQEGLRKGGGRPSRSPDPRP